jgi:MHS family proline/betaine transporter-like MFS transporter
VFFVFTPLSGFLADFFGRKKLVLISLIASVFFAFPMFAALARGNRAVDFLVIGIFSFFLAMGFAPFQVWLAEQFPSYLRTSGLGISYNVAAGVLGGTTPLLATALVQFSGSPMAPAALIVVSSLTSMVIAFTMKETANEELR